MTFFMNFTPYCITLERKNDPTNLIKLDLSGHYTFDISAAQFVRCLRNLLVALLNEKVPGIRSTCGSFHRSPAAKAAANMFVTNLVQTTRPLRSRPVGQL